MGLDSLCVKILNIFNYKSIFCSRIFDLSKFCIMFIEKLFNSVNLCFYGIKLLINLKFIESVFLLIITSYFGENNRKLKIVGMVDKIFFNKVN